MSCRGWIAGTIRLFDQRHVRQWHVADHDVEMPLSVNPTNLVRDIIADRISRDADDAVGGACSRRYGDIIHHMPSQDHSLRGVLSRGSIASVNEFRNLDQNR